MMKCLLLLLALSGAFAGPLNFLSGDNTQCATTCPEDSKLSFVPGNTYEYRYESDVLTSIPGATEESSALHMQATVQVEALSQCEMAINLDAVTLTDSDPSRPDRRQPVERSRDFKRALEAQPLRFSYINGHVESVCPSNEEQTWVVNIKRSIVSALQNTMRDFNTDTDTRETDISGTCDVSYTVQGSSWGTKTIKKTKDLMTCTGRHSADTIFQSVHYDVPSKLQTVPIVKSTHECEQQVNKAGIISQSSCKETHTFRPFSRGNSGATTQAEFTLSFQRERRGTQTQTGRVESRESLRYDHTPSRSDIQQSYREAEQTLKTLCEETSRDVRPDTPQLFNTLVRQMRQLDTRSLQALHSMASGGSICRTAEKFLHDALPTVSTEASVSVMAQLIRQTEPESEESLKWLNSLSFISTATKTMLAELKPILEMNEFSRKAALSVSSLVNTYCRDHPECGSEDEVREIIAILERNLAYNCQSEEHDKVLMALKAIGNTGHAEHVVPTLNRCFMNEKNPMEIRVAAVNAFRRMACTADRTDLESVFRNIEADSELRINAYLSLMQCPTEFLISTIRRTLEEEEVNQVGSFVWTHLTNLQETSSPFKQQARMILEDSRLQKEFDMDKRKFSRNIEKSVFSEMLNSGASVDSNLIWSTKSFLPRSATVNLTVDIFGQAVNLVEVGGRVQGLDGILEKFFSKDEEEDNIINLEGLDEINNKFKPEEEEPAQGSYFVRIFGNEIRYDDFHGLDLDSLKEKFNYLQWLIELAKTHEFDYTKSTQFLDTTLTLPTAVGLPLKLSVDGTAIMDIKVRGKLDVRNIGLAPRSMDIDGSIRPSAAVKITGEMGVDAWIAKTGLKMTSTFHTSTVADGKIQLQDGKIFNLDINMPQDQMEIFDFQSKFFITHRNVDREQVMIQEGRVEMSKCTCAKTEYITGLQLCGTLSYPDLYSQSGPWFPFNGPISAAVTLLKKDTFKNIHFEAALMQERDRSNGQLAITDIARVSFNTPGSRVDREFKFDFNLNRGQQELTIDFKSPWHKARFTGGVENSNKVRRISTTLILNEKDEYAAVAQVQNQQYGWLPVVSLTTPGRPPIRFGGTINNKNNRRIEVDLALENAVDDPITLKGIFVNKQFQKMTADFEFTSPWMNGDVNSYVDIAKGNMDGSVKVMYQMAGGRKYRFNIDQSYRYARSGQTCEINYTGSYSSTRFPGYNADVAMKLEHNANSNSLTFDGGSTRDKTKRITINQNGSFRLGATKSLAFDGSFKLPKLGWDYGLETNNVLSAGELTSNLKVKYDLNEEANFDLSMKRESASPLKAEMEAKMSYPGREMSFASSVEETSAKTYAHSMNIQWDRRTTLDMQCTYQMQPRHEFTSTIQTSYLDDPITISAHLKPNLLDFESHLATTVMRQPYSADLNWSYRQTRAGFNTRGSAEVAFQSRKVTAEAQAIKRSSNLSGRFETKWDALNDESKKFSVDGEVEMTSNPTYQAKVSWYPRQFVEVNGNYKDERPGYWGSYADKESHVNVKTSFRGYEELSYNWKIETEGNTRKFHYDSSVNAREKITWDSTLKRINGWANFEYNGVLTTPYQAVRTASIDLKHSFQNGQISCNHKVGWNGKEITLDLNGQANLSPRQLSGTGTLTTPFRGYETMSLSGSHSDDGSHFQSQLEASWEPNKKASLVFNMDHSNNGWYITNSGDLTFTCPHKTTKLTWNHKNDRDEFKPHIELEVGRAKSVFDLDATSKQTYKKYKSRITSFLTTPYMTNLRMDLTHEHDRRDYAFSKNSGSFQWAKKKIEIDYNWNRQGNNLMQITEDFKFTSPFRGYETVSYTSNVNLEGPYSSNVEIKWGTNQKINFDSNLNLQGTDFTADATLKCPWTEDIVLNAEKKMESGIMATSGSLQYHPSKKIEVATRFGNEAIKKFSIDFKTPCPYIEEVFFNVEHQGSLREFETNMQLTHNMLNEPITADIKVDVQRLSNMKAQLNIRTPLNSMPFFNIVASHKGQMGSRMTTDISIDNPLCKVTWADEVNAPSWKNFNTKTSLEYCGNNKIELTTQFNTDPRVTGEFNLKTPFEKFEDLTLTFNHAGPATDFQSNGEFSWSRYQKLGANVEFKMERNSVTGTARLTTPFRDYQTMSANFNHRGNIRNFQNDATVNFAGKEISAETEFTMTGATIRTKVTANTPFRGYETITFNFNHEGNLVSLTNFDIMDEIELDIPSKRFYWKSEFNTASSTVGKIEFRTPFTPLETLIIEMQHRGPLTNFQNSGSIQINSNTYTGNSAVKLQRGKLEASASFQVPEEYSFNLNHEGGINDFNNRFTADLAGRRLTAISNWKYTDAYNMEGMAKINTPSRMLRQAEVNFKSTGSARNFNSEGSIVINRQRGSFDATFNRRGDNLSGKLEITTPFQTARNLAIDFTHTGDWSEWENSGTIEANGQSYTATSTFSNKGNAVSGTAALRIPEEYSIEFTHRGTWQNWKNSAQIKLDQRTVSGNTAYKWNRAGLKASAGLNTPWEQLRTFDFSITHGGTSAKFENNISLRINDRQYSGNSNFQLNDRQVMAAANVNVPEPYGFTLNHDGDALEFSNSATINVAGNSYTGRTEFSMNGNNVRGSASFQLPEEYAIQFSHNGDLSNWENNGKIKIAGWEYNGQSRFTKNGDSVTAAASVELPTKYGFELTHKGGLQDFNNNGKVIYADREFNGGSRFSKNGDAVSGAAFVEIPTKYGIEFNHEGDLRRFNNDATITAGRERYTADSKFTMNRRGVVGSASLKIPTEYSIQFKHQGSLTNFNNDAVVTVGRQRYTGESRFNINGNTITGSASVKTPTEYSIEFKHEGDFQNFHNDATVMAGRERYTWESRFNMNGNILSGSASVKIPAEYGFQFNHQGGLTNFNNDATVIVGRERYTGNSRFNLNGYSVNGAASVKIPTEYGFEFKHEGDLTNFNNDATVTIGYDKLTGESMFKMNRRGLTGSATVRLPTEYGIQFNHKGQLTNFNNDATVIVGRQRYTGESRFNMNDNTVTGYAAIKIPTEYSIEFNHQGELFNFNNDATVIVGHERFTGQSRFNLRGTDLSGAASVKIPTEYGIELNHKGGVKNFNNDVTVTVAHNKYTGSSKFSLRGYTMSVAAEVNIPTQYGFQYVHEGNWDNFNCNGKVFFDGKEYTGQTKFQMNGNSVSGSAFVKIPRKYGFNFKHEGGLTSFNNEGTLVLGYKKYTADSRFNLRGNSVSGAAKVNIPDEYGVSFSHRGDYDSFSNEGSINIAGQRYTGETNFNLQGKSVSGSAKVNIPEEYSLSFNHQGGLKSFSNQGTINIAGKRYTGETNFKLQGSSVSGSAKVNIPEEYGMNFNHEGGPESFSNKGTISVAGQKYTGESNFNIQGKSLSGAAKVNIPEEYGMNFNHQGGLDSFSNEGSINIGGQRYTGEAQFRNQRRKTSGKAILRIPEEYSVDFTHSGDLSSFTNRGTAKVAGRTYTGNSEFQNDGSRIKGSAFVNIPNEYGFRFNHAGRLTNWANDGEVKYDGRSFSAESEFKLGNSGAEGRVSARIPDTYSLSFKHQGPIFDFTNEGSISWPGRTMTTTNQFKLQGTTVQGEFKVQLPDEYSLSFSHNGPWKAFTNQASVKTPWRTYSASSDFKLEAESVSGSATINIPKEYSISFSHEGPLNNFNNRATLVMGVKKYSVLSEFLAKGKKAEGRVVLRIPDMYSLKFNHQGYWKAFTNEATIKADGKKYSAGSEFRMNGNTIRGTATLRIPEEYKITFSHNGDLTDFNTNVEAILNGETYTATGTFKLSGTDIETSGQINTPWTPNMELRYNHNGNLGNFKQDSYAAYGNNRYSAKSEFGLNGNDVRGRLELGSPHESVRSGIIEFNHGGKWKNFKNSASVELNQQRYTANGEVKLFGKKKQGSITFNIPDEYSFSFIHKGAGWKDWTNKATIDVGGDKINVNSGFTFERNNVEALLSVRTPYRGVDDFGFNFNHNGDSSKFRTQAEIITPFTQYKRFSGDLSFESNGRSFKANGQISTPFTQVPITFEANHRGQINNFISKVSAELGDKRIAGDLAYRRFGKNLEFSISAQTPFRYARDMSIDMKHSCEDGYNTQVKVITPFPEYEKFELHLNHKGELRSFESSGRLVTPFERLPLLTVDIRHRGNLQDFSSSANIEYNNKKIEGEAAYKRTSGWYDGSHTGSLRASAPFWFLRNLNLNVEHHTHSNSRNGKIDVTYNSNKVLDASYNLNMEAKKNLVLSMREPHPMSVAFVYENKPNGCELSTNFNWDERNSRSNGHFIFNYEMERTKFASNGEFELANIRGSKVVYDIESTVNSRRYQSIYDGKLKLQSGLANIEGNFNHVYAPGRRYMTEVNMRTPVRKTLKSEILLNQPGVKATINLDDVVLSAEGSIGGESLFEGKASIAYSDQRFEGKAKIADLSRSGDIRYTTEWHLTHPGSFLDLEVKSDIGNSYKAASGNLEVNYMTTRDRSIKTMTLRSEINKIRDELDMQIITPSNNMRMTGRIMPQEEGKKSYILAGNLDNQEVRAELELNQDKPGADLKLYQNDNMIHLYGKYLDRSAVQFEAYRQVDGARIQEAQLAVHLNNSRLLHARAYVRPDLLEDLQEILQRDTGFSRALRETANAITDELSLKSQYLKRALRPVLDFAQTVLDALAEKAERISQAVHRMYNRNDFYLRDSMDAASGAVNSAMYHMDRHKRNLVGAAQEWTDAAHRHYRTASEKLNSYRKQATGVMYDGMIASQQYVNDAYKKVMSHPHIQTIRDTDYWQLFEQWLARVTERCNMLKQELWTWLEDYPIIRDYAEYLWEEGKAYLEKLKQNELYQMADEITRLGYDTVRDKIVEIVTEYTQFKKTRWVVWDPVRGEFILEVHLPLPLKDLKSLPHAKIMSQIEDFKYAVSHLFPKSDWNFWDTYYSYKPTSDFTNWVPPFKAHATIAGNQHFMTFDKKFFEFAGECSYLLARDFIDGKFSVIVNYDNIGGQYTKKSISVLSGGKNIEIFTNYKVNVDGSQSELPIVAGKTFVSREGNLIKVTNSNGLKIVCDLPHDRCTLDIDGWYYGKTGGLLGTYDNEQHNDLMTSERQRVSTPEQMTDSWTVGRRCRSTTNHAVHVSEMHDSRATELCTSLFRDESSPFRKCFKQVDNEAFMHMCLDEMPVRENRLMREEDTCNVASFYVDECKRHGVPLEMPKSCLSCELESGEKFSNKTLKDSEVPQSADVVMVISHRGCNTDLINKLDNIVAQVESSLKERGIRKPRYSVVGYAGEGALENPHTHTMDGEMFNSKFKFDKALQNFATVDTLSEDPLEALEYASKLPFRTGVSKSIILVPCSDCSEQAVNYADVQRLLLQRDIRLHVLKQHNFQLRAQGKATSFIFGADANGVYTNKHVGQSDITGDSGLRGQLLMPKDLCVALTEESSGSVFNSLKLTDGKSMAQKKFMDVLSRTIAKKATPSSCQICDCVADNNGAGMSVCKSCNAPSASFWNKSFLPQIREEVDQFEADLKEYLQQPMKKAKNRRNRQGRRRSN